MIGAYSKSEKPLDGVKVFEVMKRANVPASLRSYNAVLQCCHVERNIDLALEHFEEMRKEKIEPDIVTLGILMDTAVKCGRIDEALQIASAIEGTSSAQSEQFIGTLVSALVKAGRTNEAKELLRRDWGGDLKPSNKAYYSVINSLVKEEALTEAVGLFEEMKKRNIPPSVKTYGLLMQSFARKKKGIVCLELAGEMIEGGLQPDGRGHKALVAVAASYDRALEVVRSWNISPLEGYIQLLDYCAKRGDAEKVATTLDTIRQSGFGELIDKQDHSIMDKVVMAYANAKKPEEIAEVMEGMEKNGITPSDNAYASLLNLLIKTGNYESGKQLWRHLATRKEPPSQRVFLMAIKLCMAERRNFQAERVHMRMITVYGPDITAFNTMLLGYARQKYYYREVLMLLEEMNMRGLQPNAMTRKALLTAAIRRRDRILRGRPYTVFCNILERGEAGLREYKLILKHLLDRRFSRMVVEQAQAVIAEMKRRKVQPDSELILWARVIRRRYEPSKK
uniref:Pentacotripeptide-repeat region of PRORP domain-containing protein n=1 Tax=Rhodosorus marinus TaxID=101924 RepID=A0A7S3EMY5_9RHOD|mmetsp:Transcript_7366/g.32781  ORF Transcript_7366/g.32781 Transcript_7366/m.32781 type:complete len:508 (+) Transcript_7366:1886-3409(+)